MGDDYFSALKLIACEKEVVDSISCDAVINRFSQLHVTSANKNIQVHFDRAKSVVSVLQHVVFCSNSIRSLD